MTAQPEPAIHEQATARVVLVAENRSIVRALEEAGVEVRHESADAAAILAEARTSSSGLVVLGPDVAEPLAISRRLVTDAPELSVIVVAEPRATSALATALLVDPIVGATTRCLSTVDIDALGRIAASLLERAELRRRHRVRTSILSDLVERTIQTAPAGAQPASTEPSDPLTGLPQRDAAVARIRSLVADAEQRRQAAVGFIDVDRFKQINDEYGHAAGDDVLRAIAGRILHALRPADSIARFGGDEFVVVCHEVVDEASADALSQRLMAITADPVSTGIGPIAVSISVGLALAGDASTSSELLARADAALDRAKRSGRDRAERYDAGGGDRSVDDPLGEIGDRLEQCCFPAFQPIMDLTGGGVVGLEAYGRLAHPQRGVIDASTFLHPARRAGLLTSLDDLVIHRAIGTYAGWRRAHRRLPLGLATNVSTGEVTAVARQPDRIARLLVENGLEPGELCLDVPAAALRTSGPRLESALRAVAAMGIVIAVDQVGSDLPDLTQLRSLPITWLKLDRSVVSRAGVDPVVSDVLAAVVSAASSLGLGVVGAGVESADQAQALHSLGCTVAAGDHFAPATTGRDIDLTALV